jgi:16S rRNA (uracil1498-N3)-methyltransferase
MHRCFIDNDRWGTDPLRPSESESHHILHVLRVRDGDSIQLFNGRGEEAVARVCRHDDDSVLLERLDSQFTPKRRLNLTLIQAVLKGNRMEMLVEKATELGVSRIIPVTTTRSIPRFDHAKATSKRERWERIAVSAAKQCGTPWLPSIATPTTIDAALKQQTGPVLLASLEAQTRPLEAVISQLRAHIPSELSVVIGPEGDLTPDETTLLLTSGALPVSLGHLTLRAETAAIYAISALSCMLGDT